MAERSKALDWNSSNILTGVRGFESHSLRHPRPAALALSEWVYLNWLSMVARTGFSATTSRKSRQARKGAAVAAMSGAGAELVRAASSELNSRPLATIRTGGRFDPARSRPQAVMR
jgi:4-diphosphocytidyl-2C-methyl-D-erythritol kinase